MKVVWLASYPKSGNTFIRMLLHTYFFGELHDSEEVGKNIPDLHQQTSKNNSIDTHRDKKIIVKTHFRFSGNHPYAAATAGYVYILRNPRDVLLSNARYFGANENPSEFKEFSRAFINNFGVPRWQKMNMGNWPEHLASWLNSAGNIPIYL